MGMLTFRVASKSIFLPQKVPFEVCRRAQNHKMHNVLLLVKRGQKNKCALGNAIEQQSIEM